MRRTWQTLVVLTVLSSASGGCSLAPQYARPVSPAPPQYTATTADEPQGASANGGVSADLPWRAVIADSLLQAVLALTLENNRDLQVATLRVQQVQEQYRISRAALAPNVDADVSFSRTERNRVASNQWTTHLASVSYELDLFGRIRNSNRQALEQYFATVEAQRGARIALIAEAARQYFVWRRALAQEALAAETEAAVGESFALTKALVDAGAANELDLRSADAQVRVAHINRLGFRRDGAQSLNGMQLLAGTPLPIAMLRTTALPDSSVLRDVPAGLPSDLLQRRPDILEAEHTLQAAQANVGVARAAFFPAIRLTGAAGAGSSELSSLFSAGTGVWSFVPQLTVPLFRGGQNRAALASAQIGVRIEVANYEKAIQTAFREVSDALVATANYRELVAERTNLIDVQQRRFNIALARYRAGEDAYLPVLTAQQDLYSAQQGRIDAQFNQFTSQLALYKALGGGWR